MLCASGGQERRIRVLILHNIISPHVLPYFDALVEAGFDVTVLFFAESTSTRRWQTSIDASYEWEVLPGLRLELPMEERIPLQLNPSVIWKIVGGGFDVVVLFAGYDSPTLWLASAVCRLAQIPTVLRCGSVPGRSAFGDAGGVLARYRRVLTRGLVKWIVRNATAWVSYGSRSKQYLIELGAESDRVYPLWNTVDIDKLRRSAEELRAHRGEFRSMYGFGDDDVVVLYLGRFIPCKRLDRLIEAFRIVNRVLPQTKLALAGYGPSETELRRACAGLMGVKWLGAIDQHLVGRCYTAADLMVLPSADIWGLVVNEAMTFGLPVIAADTVGCSDDLIVNDSTGFVYPSQNVPCLAAKIECLAGDPELRERMGKAAQEHISQFTYSNGIGALVTAIRSAARQASGS